MKSKSSSLALSRREFLALSSAAAVGTVAGGCTSINPVTGQSQFVLMSEGQEIEIDRRHAAHQFSTDYGAVQHPSVNTYVAGVARTLAPRTHRPHMPYNVRFVNAVFPNAYTFPGGSMAVTRGMVFLMEDEATLASVLGHEMGHVNARHVAAQQARGLLVAVAIAGATELLDGGRYEKYAELAQGLGGIGAGMLLASYSRDNEREADQLGMDYMAAAGYTPQGMIAVMDAMQRENRRNPTALEMLFATHPMTEERQQNVRTRARGFHAPALAAGRTERERFMDAVKPIRDQAQAIERFQQGLTLMLQSRFENAERAFREGLNLAPNDYAGLVMMAKCLHARKNFQEAGRYIAAARRAYPEEAQAVHIEGMNLLALSRYDRAFAAFQDYERRLPGNPNTAFFRGLALERMGRKEEAFSEYRRFTRIVTVGPEAQHARLMMAEWSGRR